jgi:hypothetical protein
VHELASRSLEVISKKPGSIVAQDVANTLWALSTLDAKVAPELAKRMQGRAIRIAHTFNAQHLGSLIWALGELGVVADPELAKVMQSRAIEIAPSFDAEGISNLFGGLLAMGVEPDSELLTVLDGQKRPQWGVRTRRPYREFIQ